LNLNQSSNTTNQTQFTNNVPHKSSMKVWSKTPWSLQLIPHKLSITVLQS
jgi:hypothetical protein